MRCGEVTFKIVTVISGCCPAPAQANLTNKVVFTADQNPLILSQTAGCSQYPGGFEILSRPFQHPQKAGTDHFESNNARK
jgi:hypothetical protein